MDRVKTSLFDISFLTGIGLLSLLKGEAFFFLSKVELITSTVPS